jgi:hypothetical protein
MNIWIAEDADDDFSKALESVHRIMGRHGMHARVYRDSEISWVSYLAPVQQGAAPKVQKARHPPDIVILDFFDSRGDFQAHRYYDQLRSMEVEAGHPASWVVLWSAWSGLDSVDEFVKQVPARDRRVVRTVNKWPESLDESLDNCVASWLEAQYR